jgi:hypothetical protein
MHLDKPIMAIVPSAKGRGYFLVARDGGVFAFGDAKFTGSLPSEGIKGSVVAVTPTYDGGGYYVLTSSGKVYAFGDATMPHGVSPQGMTLSGRAVAIVAHRSPRSGLSDRRRPASPKRTSTKRTNNGNWRR